MKERRMRLTNLLIVPELVGVHAAFVVPSDDRSKFVDQAPGRTKLRSRCRIKLHSSRRQCLTHVAYMAKIESSLWNVFTRDEEKGFEKDHEADDYDAVVSGARRRDARSLYMQHCSSWRHL